MRKVVQEQKTVPLDKVDKQKYSYGAVLFGAKHFLYGLREEGYYRWLSGQKNGRSYDLCTPSLSEIMEGAVNAGEVFEFDTPQELFKWLSQ